MRTSIILFFWIGMALQAMSQSPDRLSYQAIVRNASGNLVANQPVGMRITILKGSATGSAVYVETQTRTTNANGLVTLEIGGGTAATGTFSAVNWGRDRISSRPKPMWPGVRTICSRVRRSC